MFRSPFHPNRLPFFYGWVIACVGTLGILCSLPGQTIGVSAFTESLISALSLTRTQVSFAYLIGTISSALLLPWAGSAYDRFGVRWVASVSCVCLGLVLGVLSQIDRLVSGVVERLPGLSPELCALSVLALCFFVLRFSGQGVLTMISRNMIMKWFDRRRGLVTGFTGFLISPAFSIAPWLLNKGIEQTDWRTVWLALALGIGVGFTLIVLLFFRDHPEQFGQVPDGKMLPATSQMKDGFSGVRRSFTRAEVLRTPTYWIFAIGISLFGFHFTGFSFHVASVFESAGLDPTRGFAVFIPSAVISVVLRPFIGWCADRIPLRYLLMYQLVAMSISALGVATLGSGFGIWLLILGNGLAGASFDTLMSVVWPNFYGREHVGAISSLAMAVTVFASALAPLAYSTALDVTGSYELAGWGMCVLTLIFAALAWNTRHPQQG